MRCYLYGFFAAAILIAVAALEHRLRHVCAADRISSRGALAELAFGAAGVCGPDARRVSALKDLFSRRDAIAHEAGQITLEECYEALILSRDSLAMLNRLSPKAV